MGSALASPSVLAHLFEAFALLPAVLAAGSALGLGPALHRAWADAYSTHTVEWFAVRFGQLIGGTYATIGGGFLALDLLAPRLPRGARGDLVLLCFLVRGDLLC